MRKNIILKLVLLFLLVIIVNNVLWYLFGLEEKRNIDNNKDIVWKTIDPNSLSKPINQIKKEILLYGDKSSYLELYTYMVDDNMTPEYFLFWAMLMAHKYNYDNAYYDVFECLACSYYDGNVNERNFFPAHKIENDSVWCLSLDHLDENIRNIALENLITASEKNISSAKKELGAYYVLGKYFPENKELGERLIEEGYTIEKGSTPE